MGLELTLIKSSRKTHGCSMSRTARASKPTIYLVRNYISRKFIEGLIGYKITIWSSNSSFLSVFHVSLVFLFNSMDQ